MSRKLLIAEKILTILAQTPPRMAALTAGLSPDQLRTMPGPGEWSANEVLAHLRACADVWGNCIAEIVAQDKPTLRAVNPTTWITRTNYPDLEFQPSLRAFSTQRSDLLALLQRLAPEGWSRTAMVTGAGKPLELTVLSYADRLARHERPHLKQIDRIVSAIGG